MTRSRDLTPRKRHHGDTTIAELLERAADLWLDTLTERPWADHYSSVANPFLALAEEASLRAVSRRYPPAPHWRDELGALLAAPVPRKGDHVVYRHWSTDDLLYIGVSSAFLARQRDHCRQSHWWKDITRITVEYHPDRTAAEAAELAAILSERPAWNIAGAS